ncbi:MAG: HDOD domain-containing protein [Armatimonadetes bacterium]|nr:HDOD domain-containing protein [Armatimonadota bacterium]
MKVVETSTIQAVDIESLGIRVSRCENLPVLSEAARLVLKRADDPSVGARELEVVIEKDPAMAAKLLKVANSAQFGCGTVENCARAIAVIGIGSLKSIMMNLAFQAMTDDRHSTTYFNQREYWRHSYAVAIGSKVLAKLLKLPNSEELYSAGMLHDIGMLVNQRFAERIWESVLTTSQSESQPVYTIEGANLGWTHSDAGGILAEKWNLSPLVRDVVLFHHYPERAVNHYKAICVVSLANTLAHQAGFTNNQGCCSWDIDPFVAQEVGLPSAQYPSIQEFMVREVARAEEQLNLLAVA